MAVRLRLEEGMPYKRISNLCGIKPKTIHMDVARYKNNGNQFKERMKQKTLEDDAVEQACSK